MTRRTSALRSALPLALVATTVLPLAGCHGGVHSLLAKFHHRRSHSRENTTDYADNVQKVVSSPQLNVLKWSNFSDYQTEVQGFYSDRNSELAWTRDGKPTDQATRMIELFGDAAKKGLNPADYDAGRWSERTAKLAAIAKSHDSSDDAQDTIAQFDAALTISAMRYLADLHLGRINPQSLNFDIDVPARRAAFDLPTFLNEKVVDADNLPAVVDSLEPNNPLYKATEQALPKYLELVDAQSKNPPQPLPPVSKTVSVGGSYPALPQLLQRLALEGDADASTQPNGYDASVADALKHFQTRTGLTPDGKLSQGTIDALNVPFSQRVQQINLALERWRWLPDNFQQPRVLVNLPEFLVRTYDPNGTPAFKMKVVDGEAKGEHDTPVFVRTMRYMVFRPFWNLPPSIVKKDLLRHISSGGKAYLERNNYEVVSAGGNPVSDWSADDLEHSRYMVRQKPGPKNSLGLVKFMFPNEYDIYMHSTPEMNLFNLTRRDRSHGCVRLNDAEKMANWVLDGQGDWDPDKVHQAMYGEPLPGGDNADGNGSGNNGDDANAAPDKARSKPTATDADSGATSTDADVKNNHQVNLKTGLPVVITYLTANADEDGTMHFFNDLYGYDDQLAAALAKGRPYEKATVKINPKLTPGETE